MSERDAATLKRWHDPALRRPFMVILGLEHVDRYPELVRHHEAGTIVPTIMWGACPTLFDPSQAPPDRHTAFMWEKLPYRLGGDPASWDRVKDAHGRDMLRLWADYAPGLEDRVIDRFTRSPLDVERSFPNMRHGDLLVGAFSHGQIGHDRPFPGATSGIGSASTASISAARAAIRGATSPACPATTRRRSCYPTSGRRRAGCRNR